MDLQSSSVLQGSSPRKQGEDDDTFAATEALEVVVQATGGGAHKFADLFKLELGMHLAWRAAHSTMGHPD